MKRGARPKLAGLALVVAVPLLLQPAGAAMAQTPTPTPTPTPTGTASPTPRPTASPDPTPSPGPSATPAPAPSPRERGDGNRPRRDPPRGGGDTPGDEAATQRTERKGPEKKTKRKPLRDRRRRRKDVFRPQGPFHTDRLVALGAELRARGWSRRRIVAEVYPPFIVAGPAAWTDTWGAARHGPAPGQVRSHEGQDVFCRYGDPVLAAEPGTIEFDRGTLGGKVARLHRRGGGYWYYAHLSDWNTKRLSSGDAVKPGDVIGYCGDSGNAKGTPPHVHFGLYRDNGRARDPMRFLVRWLRTAKRRAVRKLDRSEVRRARPPEAVTSARLFGDAFTPDLSELDGSPGSAGQARSRAGEAFGLAEVALQAALDGSSRRAAGRGEFHEMRGPSG